MFRSQEIGSFGVDLYRLLSTCGCLDGKKALIRLGLFRTCWHFLTRSQKMGLKPIPGHGVRNACWHFLASLLELVHPSNGTKEYQPIGHNVYKGYPQAHRPIIVAFHLKVFGYRSFIFSQRKAWCKNL
jgi:hypothetical protein